MTWHPDQLAPQSSTAECYDFALPLLITDTSVAVASCPAPKLTRPDRTTRKQPQSASTKSKAYELRSAAKDNTTTTIKTASTIVTQRYTALGISRSTPTYGIPM